jgi:hypothetical protein
MATNIHNMQCGVSPKQFDIEFPKICSALEEYLAASRIELKNQLNLLHLHDSHPAGLTISFAVDEKNNHGSARFLSFI